MSEPTIYVMGHSLLDGSDNTIFAGVTTDRDKAFAWALHYRRSDAWTPESDVSVDAFAPDGTWLAGWHAEPDGMVDNNAGTPFAAQLTTAVSGDRGPQGWVM